MVRLRHLINILNNIKTVKEPVLLHVITKKGKGYDPAENNPVYYHGVSCFEIDTGNCISKSTAIPTYTKVFGETMIDLAKKHDQLVAVTAAMPEEFCVLVKILLKLIIINCHWKRKFQNVQKN